jgi:hypothetical protein
MRPLWVCSLLTFHLFTDKVNGQNALRTKYREWIEDDNRVEVRSWYAETEIVLEQGWSLEFLGTIDAWSGATPNGLPPQESSPSNPNEWLNNVSEETRKAGLFTCKKDTKLYSLGFEYGVSDEPDYLSRSYALQYAHKFAADTFIINSGLSLQDDSVKNGDGRFVGKRNPTLSLGFQRILDKFTSISLNFSYSAPRGYLSDPYKRIPVDMAPIPVVNLEPENRPDEREIFVFYSEISRYIKSIKAGTHMRYRYFEDNHDLNGHTLEFEAVKKWGDYWAYSTSYRFYHQNQTFFYNPQVQKFETFMISPNSATGPYYSADHRLSSFDSQTLSFKVSYFLTDDVTIDAGFDRYLTQGKDGITDQKVYPDANIFTLGFQWEY